MDHDQDHDNHDQHNEGDHHEDKRAAAVVRLDGVVKKYPTYEDFLDDQINETDMYYLEDRCVARTVKELGFRGNSDKISREQFNERKAEQAVVRKTEDHKAGAKHLYTDRDFFLLELARREEANLSGRLFTVIYLRDRNSKGQEISSYIDYAQRLHEEDFSAIFAGKTRLVPKITDLSHFNWDTNSTYHNNTSNFDIIFHGPDGIQLKCRKDRRVIFVNPYREIKDPNIEDSTRTVIRSKHYAQVVLFDHYIRYWVKDQDPRYQIKTEPDPEPLNFDSMNLYDKVTAAIYEDDLLDIAKNALGGNLHYDHRGEWAPADVFATSPGTSANRTEENAPAENVPSGASLEANIIDTIKDLYNVHKKDVSFGTLGNFTFIQMIEQLGRLLPESVRKNATNEVVKISSALNNSASFHFERLPSVQPDVDDLLEETRQRNEEPLTDDQKREVDQFSVSASRINNTPSVAQKLTNKSQVSVNQNPESKSRLNPTTSKIQSSANLSRHSATAQNSKQLDGFSNPSGHSLRLDLGQEKHAGSSRNKQHQEYYRQLEKRMFDIFHGKHLKGHQFGTPYPKPVNLPASVGSPKESS